MRGAAVASVGALLIVACVLALVEFDHRAGPYDVALEPAVVEAHVVGTYHARPDSSVMALCLLPPCEARTTMELRFGGLPAGPYEVVLVGPEGTGDDVGSLRQDGDGHVLHFDEAQDHTDKDRLVVLLAGRAVVEVPVGPSEQAMRIDRSVAATWHASPSSLHANEIGGFSISTVARADVHELPPPGWALHAWFLGADGPIDLGRLEVSGDRAVLDSRIERVALERQDALVITIVPVASEEMGFPVLRATL